MRCSGPAPCPEICEVNACDCKDGYVYDENIKKCVLAKECSEYSTNLSDLFNIYKIPKINLISFFDVKILNIVLQLLHAKIMRCLQDAFLMGAE